MGDEALVLGILRSLRQGEREALVAAAIALSNTIVPEERSRRLGEVPVAKTPEGAAALAYVASLDRLITRGSRRPGEAKKELARLLTWERIAPPWLTETVRRGLILHMIHGAAGFRPQLLHMVRREVLRAVSAWEQKAAQVALPQE